MGSIGSIVRKITKLLNYEKYLQKQGVKMGSRCEIHKTKHPLLEASHTL